MPKTRLNGYSCFAFVVAFVSCPHFSLYFLAGRLSREFLGGRAMADGLSRDPDAVGRCPPYATVTSSSTPRFRSAPQLDLLVLSQEHVETIIQEERLVASPPAASPLAAWLSSGSSEDFDGPLIISWVFYRHMTLSDPQGRFNYKPNFYVRVTSDGLPPFTMQTTSEWHSKAESTMGLPACGRVVHQVPRAWVRPLLLNRWTRVLPPHPEWEFEILSMEVMLHSHFLRAARPLLGISLFKSEAEDSRSSPDFDMPSPSDLGGRPM
jgi:hypothetical protein